MIYPLNDQVFIQRLAPEIKLGDSGLLLPETFATKANKGIVRFVGPGRVMRNGIVAPMMAKPGDKVLFGKYTGGEVKHEGETYLVIKDDDIFAVME